MKLLISFTLPETGDDTDDAEIVARVGDVYWEIRGSNNYTVSVIVNPLAAICEVVKRAAELEESGFIASFHMLPEEEA